MYTQGYAAPIIFLLAFSFQAQASVTASCKVDKLTQTYLSQTISNINPGSKVAVWYGDVYVDVIRADDLDFAKYILPQMEVTYEHVGFLTQTVGSLTSQVRWSRKIKPILMPAEVMFFHNHNKFDATLWTDNVYDYHFGVIVDQYYSSLDTSYYLTGGLTAMGKVHKVSLPSGYLESYQSRVIRFTVSSTVGIGNSNISFAVPLGDSSYPTEQEVTCTIDPVPLTITATPSVNFGTVAVSGGSSSQVVRHATITVTSALIPVGGAMTLKSPNVIDGNITLGNGIISIFLDSDGKHIKVGETVPFEDKKMDLKLALDATTGTPGDYSSNLTVEVKVP